MEKKEDIQMKKRSEKIIEKIICQQIKTERTVEERLTIIEELLKYTIDNELAHIWAFIKAILGGVITILGALLISFLTR